MLQDLCVTYTYNVNILFHYLVGLSVLYKENPLLILQFPKLLLQALGSISLDFWTGYESRTLALTVFGLL